MNQGRLKVVKHEMARVNVNILGISKLKWTGMGEFNLDDHRIYYRGQESLRRNGVDLIVNNRLRNAVLDAISKATEQSQFIAKANYSISQQSKSMPQQLIPKLKLNGSMKTYKTF